jgi:hypothetical protein
MNANGAGYELPNGMTFYGVLRTGITTEGEGRYQVLTYLVAYTYMH